MTRSKCFSMAMTAVLKAGYEVSETIEIIEVLLKERQLAEYVEKQNEEKGHPALLGKEIQHGR